MSGEEREKGGGGVWKGVDDSAGDGGKSEKDVEESEIE